MIHGTRWSLLMTELNIAALCIVLILAYLLEIARPGGDDD